MENFLLSKNYFVSNKVNPLVIYREIDRMRKKINHSNQIENEIQFSKMFHSPNNKIKRFNVTNFFIKKNINKSEDQLVRVCSKLYVKRNKI